MNPILEQYIQGDKGGFLELIEVIAANTNHRQSFPLRAVQFDGPEKDIRQDTQRTKATGVIQRRKGYVSFIWSHDGV